MMERHPNEYVIMPKTYVLSKEQDQEAFLAAHKENPEKMWIAKPITAHNGEGIRILDNQKQVTNSEGILRNRFKSCIVSEYISDPHLINGYKYTVRVNVLVTSFSPLRAYVYKDGTLCFCSKKYSNNHFSLKDQYVHLTNGNINVQNKNNKHPLNWDFDQYREECKR